LQEEPGVADADKGAKFENDFKRPGAVVVSKREGTSRIHFTAGNIQWSATFGAEWFAMHEVRSNVGGISLANAATFFGSARDDWRDEGNWHPKGPVGVQA